MSIVAHQYNILSEQLRRGIGGLNEQKKAASEQALKMEQLKYGIEKDMRVEERAAARLEMERAQESRAAEEYQQDAAGRMNKQAAARQEMKRRRNLMMTEPTAENLRGILDPDGTMDNTTYTNRYNDMVESVKPDNMLDIMDNPLSMIMMLPASDAKHRDSTITKYESQIKEFEDTFKDSVPNEQEQAAYDQKKQQLEILQNAKADPIGTARKKMDTMNRFYAQITDPMAKSKAEFMMREHQKRIDNLISAESTGTGKTAIYKVDDWSGKVTQDFVMTPKGSKPTLTKEQKDLGFGFKDPGKVKPKVLPIGDTESLTSSRQKLQKGIAWAEKYGDLTQIEVATMEESEAKKHSEYPAAVEMIKNLQLRMNEVDNAISLTRQGWTLDDFREIQKRAKEEQGVDLTFEDIVNKLSVGSAVAP